MKRGAKGTAQISRRAILRGAGATAGAALLSNINPANTKSFVESQQIIAATLSETAASVAEVWAKAIHQVRYEDLSPEVIKRTKLCILDNIGVIAHTSLLESCRLYLERPLAIGGAREATVWGFNVKMSLETAAACNAFLIHGNEIDDSDFRSNYRPSCVSVAPALTVADYTKASGRDLILATAIAYTVNGLLASQMNGLQGLGFMPSSVVGPAGAAAVYAKLLKFDVEKTMWALSLGIGAGGGLFQYYFDQTEEKKLHVARAARSGVECAMMAAKGLEGPSHIVEGAAGMMPSYLRGTGRNANYDFLKRAISSFDGAMYVYPKFTSCSASIGPFIDALEPVYRKEKIRATDVAKFIIVNEWLPDSPFTKKILHFEPPQTIVGAQLNMNFTVSLFLNRGSASVYDFVEASLHDKAVLELASRAGHETVPTSQPWAVKLEMKDGRIINAPFKRSNGEQPEPEMLDRRMEKFKILTRDRLTDATRQQVIEMVDSLDKVKDSSIWTAAIHKFFKPARPIPLKRN